MKEKPIKVKIAYLYGSRLGELYMYSNVPNQGRKGNEIETRAWSCLVDKVSHGSQHFRDSSTGMEAILKLL